MHDSSQKTLNYRRRNRQGKQENTGWSEMRKEERVREEGKERGHASDMHRCSLQASHIKASKVALCPRQELDGVQEQQRTEGAVQKSEPDRYLKSKEDSNPGFCSPPSCCKAVRNSDTLHPSSDIARSTTMLNWIMNPHPQETR
ncbi:hypothetical protein CRENBAI_021597 [Crenichthys baileyi]|uniref:Uncharacterized protein n=1 Tax=Crenichthys baileyi TaxID=28760 RepID=A0AAV9S9P8_9TELE